MIKKCHWDHNKSSIKSLFFFDKKDIYVHFFALSNQSKCENKQHSNNYSLSVALFRQEEVWWDKKTHLVATKQVGCKYYSVFVTFFSSLKVHQQILEKVTGNWERNGEM